MLTRNLVSRTLFLRALKTVGENVKQTNRNAGHGVWSYRVPPPNPSKKSVMLATGLGGLCWYWILYHLATEPHHITGDWKYIDPSTWTDEELGIPPDSAGTVNKR